MKLLIIFRLIALSLTGFSISAQLLPGAAAVEQKHLQGHWEGDGPGGLCSITITNNILVYRKSTEWHKTTFTLPTGKQLQQLHATITDSNPKSKDALGQVIPALIKIENDTLTLVAFSLSSEPPNSFEDADPSNKYILKRTTLKKEIPTCQKSPLPQLQ